MKQIQGERVGGKTWEDNSYKKGQTNKKQKQQQNDKKKNWNGDTNSNIVVNLVDGKWMCLCNKGCGFNT